MNTVLRIITLATMFRAENMAIWESGVECERDQKADHSKFKMGSKGKFGSYQQN